MYRYALLLLNTIAFALLVHRLLKIYSQLPASPKKSVVMTAGFILLVLPVTMIFGFIKPTPVYLVENGIGEGRLSEIHKAALSWICR